jgi:microcystin-dependent protein
MATPYLSEIRSFAFGFAPKGWALCQGQFLPIAQNQALFALLGTMYGGNGTTTFALPDLRGRVPLGYSAGFGSIGLNLGERAGTEATTLAVSQIPPHAHTIDGSTITATARAKGGVADSRSPAGAVPAIDGTGTAPVYSDAIPNASMNAATVTVSGSVAVGNAGGSVAHENRQPYMAINYCIALTGIFPSRP